MDIKPEVVCHVIFKARELNAGDELLEDYEERETHMTGRVALDEEAIEREAHQEHEQDPTYNELKNFIDELSVDEQCELIALTWLGRDDGPAGDWGDMLRLAGERRTDHTAAYLLEMPLLADHLQEALSKFDISCEEFERKAR